MQGGAQRGEQRQGRAHVPAPSREAGGGRKGAGSMWVGWEGGGQDAAGTPEEATGEQGGGLRGSGLGEGGQPLARAKEGGRGDRQAWEESREGSCSPGRGRGGNQDQPDPGGQDRPKASGGGGREAGRENGPVWLEEEEQMPPPRAPLPRVGEKGAGARLGSRLWGSSRECPSLGRWSS